MGKTRGQQNTSEKRGEQVEIAGIEKRRRQSRRRRWERRRERAKEERRGRRQYVKLQSKAKRS